MYIYWKPDEASGMRGVRVFHADARRNDGQIAMACIFIVIVTPTHLPPPPRAPFCQILSYMCGLEQMSQLKCMGVLISVAGAVWVEFYTATSAAGDASGAAGGVGGGTAGDEEGKAGGSGPWLGSLILFWQVRGLGE